MPVKFFVWAKKSAYFGIMSVMVFLTVLLQSALLLQTKQTAVSRYCRNYVPMLYKINFDCDSAAICVDGDSRLIGGATSAEGLLETCFNGVYQPVNAEEFTVLEASTVCRQLGIATGVQMIFGFSAVCRHSKASAYLLCLQIHIAGQLG